MAIASVIPVVASATTITLTQSPLHRAVDWVVFASISGTTAITSITAMQAGQIAVLHFQSTPTLTDGSNLLLAGNLVATADDTITLICDGVNWYELCRSVN